jgi:hypothetical protein
MKEYTQSSYRFIAIIGKWKVHFLIISITAVVAAALFSSEWFIKPKYKSFAVVYPANISPYSSESETEQLLQLFHSSDVENAVINKFKLADHYGIDTTTKIGAWNLISTYESYVEINRTPFESVEIDVLDTDPQLACKMVEEIIVAMNAKARKLQRSKAKEVEVVLKNQLDFKKHSIDSINNRLDELRTNYQIFDYKIQVKELTKSYLKALSSGHKENINELKTMIHNLEEKGGEEYQLSKIIDGLLLSYNTTKTDYDNAVKELTKEFSYTNLVTKAVPSYKKAYPVRWLIVLASVASANLFLFVVLLIMDNRKKTTE